jgi:hypothetical protein
METVMGHSHLVEKIIGFMDLKELCVFRTTCKDFKTYSEPRYRKWKLPLEMFVTEYNRRGYNEINTFLTLMPACEFLLKSPTLAKRLFREHDKKLQYLLIRKLEVFKEFPDNPAYPKACHLINKISEL